MTARKPLRTSLEDLAVEFAKAMVRALLSGSAADVREILGEGTPESASIQRNDSAARTRRRPRRARILALQDRARHVAEPERTEPELPDTIIIDPEAMLRALVEQRDAPPSPAPTSIRRPTATPRTVSGDDKVASPLPPATRQPATRAGEQVLRSAGGGFVLRRSRTVHPEAPAPATTDEAAVASFEREP